MPRRRPSQLLQTFDLAAGREEINSGSLITHRNVRNDMLTRPLVPTDGDVSSDDERRLTTRPDLLRDLGQDRHVELVGVGIALGELLPSAKDELVAFAPPNSPRDQTANGFTTIRRIQPNASSEFRCRQRNLSTLVPSCCIEKDLVPALYKCRSARKLAHENGMNR